MLESIQGFGGGNVTALVGNHGILLVDTMFESMMPKLRFSLDSISDNPIQIEINSHYHWDHIQGNITLKDSTLIFAHNNVLKRLQNSKKKVNPKMMPDVTFLDTLTINYESENIKLIHFPNSHTDGDIVIYFETSKVLHTGDIFFNGMFPGIYAESGGSLNQLIKTVEYLISILPKDVKIIPGHGELATIDDLKYYLTMLKETKDIITLEVQKGNSLEKILPQNLISKYNHLGNGGGQNTDQYVTMLFGLLSSK